MMDGLYLKHFKCFANQDIPFGNLTLLTGLNGTGKSTVIQSLLLLRQSVSDGRFEHDGLQLNAELLQIGTALDARYEGAEDDTLEIGLDVGGRLHRWCFDAGRAADDLLPLQGTPDAVPDLPLFRAGLMHLSAERVGPRVLHPISRTVTERHDEFRPDGSLAVGWLHAHQARVVEPALRHAKAASDRLREQVSAWMGEVSPGVNFKVSTDSELQIARLGIGFVEGKAKSRDFRPTGVGFGISYTLPVVLACVAAREGRLILIENPEAHLHPKGQMAMGDLVARAASVGAQVIVETHSDHVLNGIRLAVRQKRIKHDAVAIHYFSRHEVPAEGEHRLEHRVQSPLIDSDGRIDHWPDGFFDQMDIALEQLI